MFRFMSIRINKLEYFAWLYKKAGKSYEEMAQDAIKYDNIHILEYAIKELGVDPNKKDDNGKNMLIKCLSYSSPEPIKDFLRKVVNQDSLDYSERELIEKEYHQPCYINPYMLCTVYRNGNMYVYTGHGGCYDTWKASLPPKY